MKKTLLILLMLGFTNLGFAQKKNWGIGLRAGESSGISVKKYFDENALEINVGRTYFLYLNNRYGNLYDTYDVTANSVQFHFLSQRNIKGGLDWYLGLGGQFVSATYKRYDDYLLEWENISDTDLGLDFLIGLEYNFAKVPLSVSLDTGLFLEMYDQFLHRRYIGGLAVRYNF